MAKLATLYGQGRDKGYTQAFLQGLRSTGYDVSYNQPPSSGMALAVFNGMERKWDEVRLELTNLGIPYVVVDLGYMHRGSSTAHDAKGYFQTSLGGLNWVPSAKCPPDRWEDLRLPLPPYNVNPEGRVMIAAQVPEDTQHHMDEEALAQYYMDCYNRLIELGVQKDKIFLRKHPFAPIIDLELHKVMPIEEGKKIPAREALKGCRAVVTYNSTMFYDALQLGVPVIADPSAHYAELIISTFNPRDWPKERWKLDFLSRMAYAQWTIPEMASGKALQFILTEIENAKS